MKRVDLIAGVVGAAVVVFFAVDEGRQIYETIYGAFPLIVTFVKFALLATGGEIIAFRIRSGRYRFRGFGVVPKMIVWGVLGIAIYAAFGIFSVGVPRLFADAPYEILRTPLVTAALISVFMNVFFAPGMMLTHHLTDVYIADHGGSFPLRGIPTAYRTIFAAAISVALGLFLGIAARTKERNDGQRARSRPR